MSLLALALSTVAATISSGVERVQTFLDENPEIIQTVNLRNPSFEPLLNRFGEPSFFLAHDENNYFLVDIEKEAILEKGTQDENPYRGNGIAKIFNDGDGPSKYLESDGSSIWLAQHPDYQFATTYGCGSENEWDEGRIYSVPAAAQKCNNYEYFLKLNDWHGKNDSNIYTLVAIQIISGYYDAFLNDNFVPEIWDKVPRASLSSADSRNWKNWAQAPGTGCQGKENPNDNPPQKSDSRMRDFLKDYCLNYVNSSVQTSGNTISQQLACLDYYLTYAGVRSSCNLDWSEGNLADNISGRTLSLIKSTIDAGRPLIVNGYQHSTVAFAYDDSYVYVHTGWGYPTRVPIAAYTDWDAFYSPTAIDLNPLGAHSHNDNFYSDAANMFYCSCGAIRGGSLIGLNDLVSVTYDTATVFQKTFSTPKGSATVSTKHARKIGSDILLDATSQGQESFIEIRSPSDSIRSLSIDLVPSFLGSAEPDYEIECMNVSGVWSDTFHLSDFTDLYFERPSYLQLNLEEGTRGIRIKINAHNSEPKLTMKKLVLAYC